MKLFKTLNMHVVSVCQEQFHFLLYPVFNSPTVLRNSWTSCTSVKLI